MGFIYKQKAMMMSGHSLYVCMFMVVVCFACSSSALASNQVNLQACSLKTMKMKMYDPGCKVKTIRTKGCHGYCISSSMYLMNIQKMKSRCKCCKVKEYALRYTDIDCPLLQAKTKTITYREATQCECQGCS